MTQETINLIEIIAWLTAFLVIIWIIWPRHNMPSCEECSGFRLPKYLSWVFYPWRGKIKGPEHWKFTDKNGIPFPGEQADQYYCFKCYRAVKKDIDDIETRKSCQTEKPE
jgi:hypothetical protein